MTTLPMENVSWLQTQLGVGYLLLAFALITTLLRLWTRAAVQHHVGVDDWLVFFAMALGIGGIAVLHRCTILTDYLNRVSPEGAREYPKALPSLRPSINEYFTLIFGWEMAYGVQLMSIKLSMLAFYIRCFALHRTRIWVYLIAATQIIATIVANTLYVFVNSPVQANFDMWLPDRRANFPGERIHIGYSIYNLVTDVLILAMPIPIVAKLQMRWQKKVGLLVVFLLGGLTTVMTALRLYVFIDAVGGHRLYIIVNGIASDSLNYINALVALDQALFWSCVETSLGIVCVNAPTMAALFRNLKGRLKSRQASSKSLVSDQPVSWRKKTRQDSEDTTFSQEGIIITKEVDQTSDTNIV